MLRIVLEQVNEFQESWYLVFIDYEMASDSLNHVDSPDAQSENTIICYDNVGCKTTGAVLY